MIMKKLLNCMLALFLLLSISSINIFAEGEAVSVYAADGSLRGNFNTLKEAADSAENGDTIKLNADIEMGFFENAEGNRTDPTMLIENKSVLFDGQNHKVTAKDEAFSMIKVGEGGEITIKNVTLDGSAYNDGDVKTNRNNSNILLVEGGTAYIEDNTVMTNNITSAVNVGRNKKGGTVVMNGGEITGNVQADGIGSPDTGVSVTAIDGGRFIMNGGSIHDNKAENGAYGTSAIMINRGSYAEFNGGEIYNMINDGKTSGTAIRIQGGEVVINDIDLHDNTTNYGAIYVTNHSSFTTRKWDGILNINGGHFYDNGNVVYLWSKNSIEGTGAYVYLDGKPVIEDQIYVVANDFSNLDYKPVVVKEGFEFNNPIYFGIGQSIDSALENKQEVIDYEDGILANNEHFIHIMENIGYQVNAEGNYLYPQYKREIAFVIEGEERTDLGYWEFVKDYIDEPTIANDEYVVEGWYKDAELTNQWDFSSDTVPNEDGKLTLYAKIGEKPQEEVKPSEEPSTPSISCAGEKDKNCDGVITCDEEKGEGWTWNNAKGVCEYSGAYTVVNTSVK